jgi:hypothetical protein
VLGPRRRFWASASFRSRRLCHRRCHRGGDEHPAVRILNIAQLRELFTDAKAVSTAVVLSGDRVNFGGGAGWSADEWDQLLGRLAIAGHAVARE